MNQLKSAEVQNEREIVHTRIINAPRELVFQAWTDPENIAKWWGPNGFTTTIHEMDVRPGGVWRYIMHGPDGVDYNNKVSYTEVVKPERLVYDHGDDEDPTQFNVTVTFEDLGGKTRLTMRSRFRSAEELKKVVEEYGAIEGGKQTLDRMELYLTSVKS